MCSKMLMFLLMVNTRLFLHPFCSVYSLLLHKIKCDLEVLVKILSRRLCFFSAALHVRSVARLGHPHVPLPRHRAPLFELPHCQVSASPAHFLSTRIRSFFYRANTQEAFAAF